MPSTPPSPLAHAISGSLGSALALLVFYPLERVRTELQSSATPLSTSSSALTPSLPLTPPPETQEHQDAGDNPEEQKQQDTPISPQSHGRVALMTTSLSPSSSGNSSSDSWILCHDDPVEAGSTHETGAGSGHAIVGRSVSCSSSPPETLLACWIRLQEQGELYRGIGPVVTTLAASNFVFFFVHQALKRFESKKLKSTWKAIFLSTLAGVVNVVLTNPLWVANLRIMKGSTTNNNSNLLREMHAIARKEGVASLWNGSTSSLLLVTNPVIQFFCYEQFKQFLIVRRQRRHRSNPQHSRLEPLEAFVLGALAKAIATIITYPLQLSQVLLRLQESNNANNIPTSTSASAPRSSPYNGTVSCLRYLLQARGLPALFTGLEAKLLQTCLTAALTFCTYEQLLRAVQKTLFDLNWGRRSA